MSADPSLAGVLLTGGESRRLGVDKATLVFDGERLVDRAARRLAAVCDPAIEVGPGYSSLRSVRESPAQSGPLCALVAGAAALREAGFTGSMLVLATDLPEVDVGLLSLIASWPGDDSAVPVFEGRRQYLCARWSEDALAVAARMVGEGVRSLHALADAVTVIEIGEADWEVAASDAAFADVDTAADAARLGIKVRR